MTWSRYIYSDLEATRWSVTNLTVYITHHYNSVFYVYPQCSDWTLQHVVERMSSVRLLPWTEASDQLHTIYGLESAGASRREPRARCVHRRQPRAAEGAPD